MLASSIAVATPLEAAPSPFYLRIDDAARLALCSPSTLRRAIKRGELRVYHAGIGLRFKPADLRAWIEAEKNH